LGPRGWEAWESITDGPDASYSTPGSYGPEEENRQAFEEQRTQLQREALVDIEALGRQYSGVISSLRNQYQTAETPQEKERLRFILSDIEAQYEAGVQAISSLYSDTTNALNRQAFDYRAGIQGRASGIESSFTQLASSAVDRNMAQRQGLAADNRGLGVAVGYDARDANTDFLASLAPIQGNYSRMMGEATAGGIEFMANLSQQQGLATQADLQRLAAVTRTAAIQTHQQQVDARVQSEIAAQRSDMNNMRMAALSAQASARDLNARLMSQAIQAQEYIPGGDGGERYANMTTLSTQVGERLVDPSLFVTAFKNQFGGAPAREFMEMYMASYTASAMTELATINANIQRLNLTPQDPSRLSMEERIRTINNTLNVFGIVPSAPGSTPQGR
jgi:hypothetical protein